MYRRVVIAALTVVALAAPAAAQADHRELIQVSRGDTAGNSSNYATYGGASADGSKVWFSTADALVPEDTDGESDVYERSNGTLELISVPEGGPYDDAPAGFIRASADGSTVVFSTSAQMTPEDDDGSGDWFARRDGHTYLVTKPDPDAFLLLHANPLGTGYVTPDGGHVFFITLEDLGPGDSNFQVDLYDWSAADQSVHPVSVDNDGHTGSGGTGLNVVAIANTSGTRAFFETRNALVPEDTDGGTDIYMRENGQTTLVTPTTTQDTTLRQLDDAGEHVLFQTYEALVPEDTDTERDVYDVQPGGDPVLESVGPASGPTSSDADFQRVSPDGSRVFFTTYEHLVPEDTDDNSDIYMRENGVTTLETQGPTGGNTGFDDIVFSGLGPDGTRMYFTTHEALTADDTDFAVDIYERHDGQTRRVSVTAEPYDNGFGDANFAWASPDGSRVIFQSQDPMLDGDVDINDDLYEWFGGKTVNLTGGTKNIDAIWGSPSTDGSRVFLTSTEQLTSFDTDDQADVFESRINRSPVLTAGAATKHVAGTAAEPADPAVAIDDADTDAFTRATVTLGGTQDATEALDFTDQNGIQGELSSDKHTLTLSGSASLADYQSALRAVNYGGGSTPGSRTVSFTLTDGFDTSNDAVHTLEVAAAPPAGGTEQQPDTGQPGSPPSSGGTPSAPRPRLSSSAPDGVVVEGDQIEVGCKVSGGSVETCSADAFMGSGAARLVRIGHGSKHGAGVVRVKLTEAGIKRLRDRGRASHVFVRVTARVKGVARRLRARHSVRVLVPGTEMRPHGVFAGYSAELTATQKSSLRRMVRDLRLAAVVRCEGHAAGTSHGPIAEELGLARAEAVCRFLRAHGVRAKLHAVSFGNRHLAERRVVLRIVR